MEIHKAEKPKKRRKALWILLIGVLVLLMAVAVLYAWQKNNIEAVKQFSQYAQDELEQQLQDNDQNVQDILGAALEAAKQIDGEGATIVIPDVTPLLPESSQATQETVPPVTVEPELSWGSQTTQVPEPTPSVSPESTAQQPAAPVAPSVQTTPVKPEQPPQTSAQETTSGTQAPVQSGPTYAQQMQVIVDKVYALRAEYLQELDNLQAAAIKDYKAIPKDKRTKKAIVNFVSTYISKATRLEKECDGKMDALVKELTVLQKQYKQSMELVEAVKYTYANEKSLKKAWYMSELERRGLS